MNQPFRNYKFRVEIDQIAGIDFADVALPVAERTVIEYREGGNPLGSRKLPGRLGFGPVVLRRGLSEDTQLYRWWRSIQQGVLDRRNLAVILEDDQGNEVKRWRVHQAWPSRYQISQLQASDDDVLTETIELAHEGIDLA